MAPDRHVTESGIEVKPVYGPEDAVGPSEQPGEFPFTRGPYRGHVPRPAVDDAAVRGVRLRRGDERALPHAARARADRPLGGVRPPDAARLRLRRPASPTGEVGRTGVAIDSVDDMERLLAGIPLAEVSTSMTINAPAALLLLCYELAAAEQGVPGEALRGTVQNDVLKEYVARGNYIFPPRPSMRLTTDLFAYCAERIPRWNTISISGYHIREAGSTAAQELAFTLANGIAYCEAAVAAGLSPGRLRRHVSPSSSTRTTTCCRRWRSSGRLGGCGRRSCATGSARRAEQAQALRFHAQTGGSTLTAQQPENNLVRVAAQALSAVYGGAQSIHTNGFDEALALPTERAATLALRTQQILMHEAGTTATADPLGGSWFVEALTDELEEQREGADRADRRARRRRRGDRGRRGCRSRSRSRRSPGSGTSRAASA